MLEKVIKNGTSRLDYIRGSRGSPMPEIIFKISKNITDTDFDDENEMNNAAPVSTSSGMRSIMRSIRSYLGAHSNNKVDDVDQFVDNLTLK
ncbi:hypothetical protein TNCV_4053201 [Trichonephila clavipes]|nr:hypothetical protein TNCV_4053201 [Trichonephila clavipes]